MTSDYDDALLRRLRQLPALEPDAARIRCIRARCQAVVAKREQRTKRAKDGGRFKAFLLEATLVGAFSLVYLCAIMYNLLRLSAVW